MPISSGLRVNRSQFQYFSLFIGYLAFLLNEMSMTKIVNMTRNSRGGGGTVVPAELKGKLGRFFLLMFFDSFVQFYFNSKELVFDLVQRELVLFDFGISNVLPFASITVIRSQFQRNIVFAPLSIWKKVR